MYAGKRIRFTCKRSKNEFWLNSEQKQFLKDTKARLGTIKILNVNPKNPKDHICIEEEKANITSIVGTCGFSFIYIFLFCLLYGYTPIIQQKEKLRRRKSKEN